MPGHKRLDGMNCSLARALDAVGDWWTLLILRDLFVGASRFGEFRRSLGIAANILTDRLERLEASEIVQRDGTPHRAQYRLTDKGRDLFPALVALMQWGDKWAAPDGPPMRVTGADGAGVAPVEVRSVAGAPLDPKAARFRAGSGATAATRAYVKAMQERKFTAA